MVGRWVPSSLNLFILGFNSSSETQGHSVGLGKRRDENIPRDSPAYAWKLSSLIFPNPTVCPGSPRMGSTFPQHFCLSLCCCFFLSSKQSIYVTKVQPDGPAAFGLVPGDRILEVGEYFWPYILLTNIFKRSFSMAMVSRVIITSLERHDLL